MNRTGIYLMIAGIIVVIVGALLFQNLQQINAVDSIGRTTNINGIRSINWPRYIGIVLFVVGLITFIAPKREKGHRVT